MNKIKGRVAQIRGRLTLVCLLMFSASAFGAVPQVLIQEKRWQAPEKINSSFDLPAIPPGEQVRLSLDVRIDDTGFGGSAPCLYMRVNGAKPIGAAELLNKRPFFVTANGEDAFWINGGSDGSVWRAVYSPDFSNRIRTERTSYRMPEDDPYHFVFDITQFVTPGTNTLPFEDECSPERILVLRHVQVEIGAPLPRPVEQILAESQCDGFYVDGWSYDPYEWTTEPPWDNCSVNIDADKHSVTGRITSTVLLQQPWKVNFVK